MSSERKIGIFQKVNQIRSEISTGDGDDAWIIRPAVLAALIGITTKEINRMAREKISLTFTPLSSEKVRISRTGFRGTATSYRELYVAVQETASGKKSAFKSFSPDLENWGPLQDFRERMGDGEELPEAEDMQNLLSVYWKTLGPATKKILKEPSQVFNSVGLERSGV